MVIAAVLERIINGVRACTTVGIGGGYVAPRIIEIGDQQSASVIIDSHDISLHILFEPVGVKYIGSIGGVAILHPQRCAFGIVQVNKQVITPLLCYDLRTGQMVGVRNTVNGFTGTDARVGIGIRIRVSAVDILHELSAAPCQRRGTDCGRISDGVVSDRCSVVRGQKFYNIMVFRPSDCHFGH